MEGEVYLFSLKRVDILDARTLIKRPGERIQNNVVVLLWSGKQSVP